VGTFTPWDGAEKIKDLAECYTNIEFLLVGDGPGRTKIQNDAPKNMLFTGMVNYSELPALYADSDAAIVIYEFERHRNVELSSIKTLEYLASRLPVFSTDVPGQEMIKKRDFGYLVSEGQSICESFALFKNEHSKYSDALWAIETDELVSIIGWRKTAMETMGVLNSF
jgi:glycosyltransferase involved in cell wall biosynthesis